MDLKKRRLPIFMSMILLTLSYLGCQTQPGLESVPNRSTRESDTLQEVKARNSLTCGVNGYAKGFSGIDTNKIPLQSIERDDSGRLQIPADTLDEAVNGFDVDICKAIAAAIFGDPEGKVEYVFLDASARFSALKNGDIDVLSRNTTFTIGRDITTGAEFGPIYFYDGQSIMVPKDSGIQSLKDFNGKTICVEIDTTSETNIKNTIKRLNLNTQVRTIQNREQAFREYEANKCQGITTDKSQLAGSDALLTNYQRHVVLNNITLSKEPFATAVREDDLEWLQIIRIVIYTLIQAEELGINQNNLSQMIESKDQEIRRFLGLETGDSLGERLNLQPEFSKNIIEHVGNYGEIYNRHLGPNSPTPIDRDLNNLWNAEPVSGLIYSPPF